MDKVTGHCPQTTTMLLYVHRDRDQYGLLRADEQGSSFVSMLLYVLRGQYGLLRTDGQGGVRARSAVKKA